MASDRKRFHGVSEQRRAAIKRLADAKALLQVENSDDWRRRKGPHARGAMYLAGYAVECKLKSIAMEVRGCKTLAELSRQLNVDERDIYSHGLESLLELLPGLRHRLHDSPLRKTFFSTVSAWRPSWRYDPEDHENAAAEKFVTATEEVYHWLDCHQC